MKCRTDLPSLSLYNYQFSLSRHENNRAGTGLTIFDPESGPIFTSYLTEAGILYIPINKNAEYLQYRWSKGKERLLN